MNEKFVGITKFGKIRRRIGLQFLSFELMNYSFLNTFSANNAATLCSVHPAYYVCYIVSLKIFRRTRATNIFLEGRILSSPNLTHSYRRRSLGYLSRYSEYSQKSRKRDSILERGKRFIRSVKSTDRSWARCGLLSSRAHTQRRTTVGRTPLDE